MYILLVLLATQFHTQFMILSIFPTYRPIPKSAVGTARQLRKHVKDERCMDKQPSLPTDKHPMTMYPLLLKSWQSVSEPNLVRGRERPIRQAIVCHDPGDVCIPVDHGP